MILSNQIRYCFFAHPKLQTKTISCLKKISQRLGELHMIIDMNYWGKVLKNLLIFIFSIIGIFLGFRLAVFYMPFLIAFILSLLLEPLIRWFMRQLKLKRKTSSIIVFFLAIGIIVCLLIWGITTLVTESSNLLGNLNQYLDQGYEFVQNFIAKFDFEKWNIPSNVREMIQNSASNFFEMLSTWAKNVLTGVMGFITSIPSIGVYTAITLLSLYFICVDKVYMIDQMEHHLPQVWVKKIGIHLKEITKSLGGYLKAQATLVFVSFCISLIGLYILHFAKFQVAYPLLMALTIAFVDALPIFGSGSFMIPWAMISGLSGNLKLGIAILVLWMIMSVTRQLIEPKIVSGKIGIHPIFTLVAMYTGFQAIGILGMMIGPIILIILKNLFATLIERGVVKSIFER